MLNMRKLLIFFLIVNISGVHTAFAQTTLSIPQLPPKEYAEGDRVFFGDIQNYLEKTPAGSLSSQLTLEFQKSIGLNPGDIRSYIQIGEIQKDSSKIPVITEYIQGHVTIPQLVEVVSRLQNDFLKILLTSPKTKFKLRYIQKNREIVDELPVKFFIDLLRETGRLDFQKIQDDPILSEAMKNFKDFNRLVTHSFETKELSNGEKTFFPKSVSDRYTKVQFAILRFSGIVAVPTTAAFVVSPLIASSLGMVVSETPDLNVFITTQVLLGAVSLTLSLFSKQFAKWIIQGAPNFSKVPFTDRDFKWGNSKFLEYGRWYSIEVGFLALIPLIGAAFGVYPDMSWMEYYMRAFLGTALVSTATQGIWDIIIFEKYYDELNNARLRDGLRQVNELKSFGSRIFNMSEVELASELRSAEEKATYNFNKMYVVNSILSVSLASVQSVAISQNMDFLAYGTWMGFAAYGATGIYHIAKKRVLVNYPEREHNLKNFLLATWLYITGKKDEFLFKRTWEGFVNFFKNKKIVEPEIEAKKQKEHASRQTTSQLLPLSCQRLFAN